MAGGRGTTGACTVDSGTSTRSCICENNNNKITRTRPLCFSVAGACVWAGVDERGGTHVVVAATVR